MTPISPEYTREDLIIMIHQRDGLVSDLKEVCEKKAARIETLEAALRGAEQEWVSGEIKLLDRIKEMLGQETMGLPAYSRKHIMDEIDLAIAALDK